MCDRVSARRSDRSRVGCLVSAPTSRVAARSDWRNFGSPLLDIRLVMARPKESATRRRPSTSPCRGRFLPGSPVTTSRSSTCTAALPALPESRPPSLGDRDRADRSPGATNPGSPERIAVASRGLCGRPASARLSATRRWQQRESRNVCRKTWGLPLSPAALSTPDAGIITELTPTRPAPPTRPRSDLTRIARRAGATMCASQSHRLEQLWSGTNSRTCRWPKVPGGIVGHRGSRSRRRRPVSPHSHLRR